MRLLVTGGCGFIGSNFINRFRKRFLETYIVNYDRLDYCASVDKVAPTQNYKLVQGDLNDSAKILELLETNHIDTVVHFAAQTHVDNSFGNSIQFTIDNVLGTHTLLECCRAYGKIERFIHISTDEVYGSTDGESMETSILDPTNPYAATKAGAEFIVRSYYHSFNLPVIITRGNNVYGPQQYPEKLIPKFIMHLKNNQKCTIHGQGLTRRNFIYVDDVADAIIAILFKGEINHIYNIGTKNEYSVMEIADMLVKSIKNDTDTSKYIEYVEDRKFNDFRYNVNTESLKSLGWCEKTPFAEGLARTIDWYMK